MYILAIIHPNNRHEAYFKFLHDPSIEYAYKRYLGDPTLYTFSVVNINNWTLEEVEDYCERYSMCVLRP